MSQTSPFHPTPTIDHVVVNARDNLDAAAAAYERLGFTLTPRGHHTLGSANNLAIFGNDYLELIGVMDPASPRTDVMGSPIGLNGLVFGAEDSAATYASLVHSGVAATAPREFSRPVELPTGPEDAVFRTVHLTPQAIWPGRIYFCHHFTRQLVWRDEWRHHANGAIAVARMVIASDDPQRLGTLFGTMFGPETVRATAGGVTLAVGLSRVDVLDHGVVAGQLGAGGDQRAEHMAGLTLRTVSLAQTECGFAGMSPHRRECGQRIIVPAVGGFRVHPRISRNERCSAIWGRRYYQGGAGIALALVDLSGGRAGVQLCRGRSAGGCGGG